MIWRVIGAWICAVVISICLSPVSIRSETSDNQEVSVVFYNLKNYLAMERRVGKEVVKDAPKPESEVKHLIAGIVDIQPDILGVCELGDPSYMADFKGRLKKAGVDLPHTELVTAASGHNRNLALLSRYPIIEVNSRDDYTYTIGDTKLPFQRGVLDVTIAINPRYHLRYVALHLKSKRDVPEADQALMRLNEARLARQHLDQIFEKQPGINLVVMGDFNDLRIEPPVKALQGNWSRPGYLSSLTLDDHYGFRWTYHWSYADSYSRFDYALYSRGLSPEINRPASHIHHWDDWDKASDHRPLVMRIMPEDQQESK